MHMRYRHSWLLVIVVAASTITKAQTAKVYISSQARDRLTVKPDLKFAEKKPTGRTVFEINDAVHFQKMDGFGASFMEAGLMTLNTLPADKQEEVLRALFDAK